MATASSDFSGFLWLTASQRRQILHEAILKRLAHAHTHSSVRYGYPSVDELLRRFDEAADPYRYDYTQEWDWERDLQACSGGRAAAGRRFPEMQGTLQLTKKVLDGRHERLAALKQDIWSLLRQHCKYIRRQQRYIEQQLVNSHGRLPWWWTHAHLGDREMLHDADFSASDDALDDDGSAPGSSAAVWSGLGKDTAAAAAAAAAAAVRLERQRRRPELLPLTPTPHDNGASAGPPDALAEDVKRDEQQQSPCRTEEARTVQEDVQAKAQKRSSEQVSAFERPMTPTRVGSSRLPLTSEPAVSDMNEKRMPVSQSRGTRELETEARAIDATAVRKQKAGEQRDHSDRRYLRVPSQRALGASDKAQKAVVDTRIRSNLAVADGVKGGVMVATSTPAPVARLSVSSAADPPQKPPSAVAQKMRNRLLHKGFGAGERRDGFSGQRASVERRREPLKSQLRIPSATRRSDPVRGVKWSSSANGTGRMSSEGTISKLHRPLPSSKKTVIPLELHRAVVLPKKTASTLEKLKHIPVLASSVQRKKHEKSGFEYAKVVRPLPAIHLTTASGRFKKITQ